MLLNLDIKETDKSIVIAYLLMDCWDSKNL